MATDRDDELAQTATALPEGKATPAPPVGPSGTVIGRYRIEREIGAGGMGVVHAAFDPDLERRVALKVLKHAGTEENQKRLLREARAMARLSHPNVVTVHEVGSIQGRDYVAMELVEGDTLADWLRASPRAATAIVDAFIDAGRGLAAAHAAGIVHRDFKPHNVLRSKKGRIVVTDFGLAREASLAGAAPVLPAGAEVATTTPSALEGLTVTGSVLGTPAYMAPEQWTGGAVTPATDQFGFCVALWEALAGERPYKGPTLEDLKAQVAEGPQALDDSRIPRRLRMTLKRGLDPQPGKRWPAMDDLLKQLARAERRPGWAIVIAAGAVTLAAVLIFTLRSRTDHASLPPCPPPILDPATVWSSGSPATLAKVGQGDAARAIAADLDRWQALRGRTCGEETSIAAPRLVCLDGVLARLSDVAHAVGVLHDAPSVDAGRFLVAPEVCIAPSPPRLSTASSPALQQAFAAVLRDAVTPGPPDREAVATLVTAVESDPCAAAFAHALAAGVPQLGSLREHELSIADQAADRCGDDRVRAEIALALATYTFETQILGGSISDKLSRADAAVHRVAQPDLIALVDTLRMDLAARSGNFDEAIARGEAAMAGFAARNRLSEQLSAGLSTIEYRAMRAKPEDLVDTMPTLDRWRALAVAQVGEAHPLVRSIDRMRAVHLFNIGDVLAAHALFERTQHTLPQRKAQELRGKVVDRAGAPVAGAQVSTATTLYGDPVGVIMFQDDGSRRDATTAADGTFVIPDAPADGVVIALHDKERSAAVTATSPVTLTLAPTARVEGKVALHGAPASGVAVAVVPDGQPRQVAYTVVAPVAADGSFVADGAPRGKVQVSARSHRFNDAQAAFVHVDATGPVVRGVELDVQSSTREVQIIVRSTVGTAVPNAQVIVTPGTIASATADKLLGLLRSVAVGYAQPIEGERAPKAVLSAAHAGDLYSTLRVPDGPATACALSLPGDLADPDLQRKIDTHLAQLEFRCVPLAPDAEQVVVEVPPFPRLD